MNSPFFTNVEVEIYESVLTGQFDRRGEEISEFNLRCKVPGDLQAVSVNESLEQYGEILQDTFKLYLNTDVIVEATDLIKINGEDYTITGGIQDWNHILPFKKVVLQRNRKGGLV